MANDSKQNNLNDDYLLVPKEVPVGAQNIRAVSQDARAAQEQLAQTHRLNEDKLAEDIIEEARTRLMLKFRFLDKALWRMNLSSVRSSLAYPIATNAKAIYYDPERVIARFRQSIDEVVRDYLHLIIHCIFRHPFDTNHKEKDAWSLTCDIIAESVAMDLCGTRFPSEDDEMRRQALDEIAFNSGSLLPEKIYDFLCALVRTPSGQSYHGYTRSTLNEWRRLFERDDHGAWPSNERDDSQDDPKDEEKPEEMVEDDENPDAQSDSVRTETLGDDQSGGEDSEDSQNAGESEAESDSEDDSEERATEETAEEGSDEAQRQAASSQIPDDLTGDSQDEEYTEKDWEEIAKEMEMNLETFSKEWGKEAGKLIANLQLTNRKTYDYTEFLRQFMTITEQIKLNLDEFDYTYYTFGMDMYGNMPFIEPLEYKETDTVHDFVIAIDTSGSVSGDLVRKFIQHTFNILKESEDQSTEVNIHIIQADSKVQSDLKITDLRDVNKLMTDFSVRGFGGTDFRPVFEYVDMLRKRGELDDLKGLIYFTDGMGQFPESMADYDTAFVFVDDGTREIPPVPPWAIKLVIDEHDIEKLQS